MLKRPTRNSLIPILAAVVALLVIAVVFYFFNPESYGFYPRCPFFVLTGLQCAGCGGSRAVHSLLHGDFRHAFELNPLLFLAAPFVLLLFLKPAWARKPWVGAGAVVIVIGYTLLRNIC